MNRTGYKVYSDSTLMRLPKRTIIELLRIAEYNFFETDKALDNSVQTAQKMAQDAYGNGYSDAKDAMIEIYGLAKRNGNAEEMMNNFLKSSYN